MKFVLVVFVSVFILHSCNYKKVISENGEADIKTINSKGLKKNNSLILKLDSVTGPLTTNLQYIAADDQLAYWNSNDYSIQFFDLKSGKVTKKIFYERSGRDAPNSNYSTNFYYHNKDSLFSRSLGTIHLFDEKAMIKGRFPSGDLNKIDRVPDAYVWTGSPFTFYKGKLYYQVYIGGIFDQAIIASLDLKEKEINYFGAYPEFYQQAYWRGGFEYWYYTFNRSEGLFVQSFEADHNVRVIDLNKPNETAKAYYASSSDFPDLIAPSLKMGETTAEEDEIKYRTQPSFGLIHYDKYNELYYRFAFDRINDTDLNDSDPDRATVKRPRIIILDKGFQKIGEFKLPRFKYDTKISFVGKEGLYIKVIDKENEDILTFDVFEPVDLEQ